MINNEHDNITQWLNANRPSLSIDKRNSMILRPKEKHEVCPAIPICGARIQEVDRAKVLGIMIDNELNWGEHLKQIAKDIGIIIKARQSFWIWDITWFV